MPVIEVSDMTLHNLDRLRIQMQAASYDEVIRRLLGMEHIGPVYIEKPEPAPVPEPKRPDDGIGVYMTE
ncbi:MAG TPA: hypothetical protein ENF24_05140 [Methanosarcinales archaeon]|nr:hypothetical protein [Methanosarcinales archaeon]